MRRKPAAVVSGWIAGARMGSFAVGFGLLALLTAGCSSRTDFEGSVGDTTPQSAKEEEGDDEPTVEDPMTVGELPLVPGDDEYYGPSMTPGTPMTPAMPTGPSEPVGDGGMNTTPVDAGAPMDAAPKPDPLALFKCASNEWLKPVNSNDESQDTINGCNTKNAMLVDQMPAGLDWKSGSAVRSIDGHMEAGCLKVDFGSVRNLNPIVIYRRSVNNACAEGTPCTGTGCMTGRKMDIFRGNKDNVYTWVGGPGIGDVDKFGRQFINLPGPARYVVICRPAVGPTNADLEVDGVMACKN